MLICFLLAGALTATPAFGQAGSRIEAEVADAQAIVANLNSQNLFDNPFVVYAIYYHDGVMDHVSADSDVSARIIWAIRRVLTPERKRAYMALLHERCPRIEGSNRFSLPVAYAPPTGRRRRQTHKFAIDLFAHEGSPVRAASGGLVILADSGWERSDPFSTGSVRGGNAVIVFDPTDDHFYRYCHLDHVMVKPGIMVQAGQQIGTVGHTGLNACRPGHGGHLHFEINEYDGHGVSALNNRQLRAWLQRVGQTRRTAQAHEPESRGAGASQ